MIYNLEKEAVEVGYFLARMGKDAPPSVLQAATWKEAYTKFYGTFGIGKTEIEFKNSLKNLRDHFDGHLDNRRVGWKDVKGEPEQLSAQNQHIFNELEKLNDQELWHRIKPYAVTSYNASLSKEKNKLFTATTVKFFSSEFKGKKKIKSKQAVEANVSHGLVVDHLKQFIDQSISGSFTFNTQKIDLALEINDSLVRIYEVKTSTDTQSIYTAVGQLFMHTAGAENIERWLVVPGPDQNTDLINCLSALNIFVLWYELGENFCNFTING